MIGFGWVLDLAVQPTSEYKTSIRIFHPKKLTAVTIVEYVMICDDSDFNLIYDLWWLHNDFEIWGN